MAGSLFDIKVLEGALKWWEDVALVYNMMRHMKTVGRIRKSDYQKLVDFPGLFRGELLTAGDQNKQTPSKRFAFEETNELNSLLNTLGLALYRWNHCSRRVFSLGDDLRLMLEATSFKSVKWNEVPWPFDCFVLAFEKPIAIGQNCSVSAVIWVNLEKVDPVYYANHRNIMILLPTGLENFVGSTPKQCMQLLRNMQNMDMLANEKWMKRWDQNVCGEANSPGSIWVAMAEAVNQSIETRGSVASTYPTEGAPIAISQERVLEIARLVAAFAFYLTTLSVNTPEHRERVQPGPIPPAIKRNDPRLVSLASNVCRVTSSFTLSTEEKEVVEDVLMRERTGQLVPQWRRGHFRRPPGMGLDITAARTVWVEPYFANVRHLPEGSLPGGAHMRVLAPANGLNYEIV